jgi:glycosyltransferase involved in cell wall biosynthesis
MEGGSNLPNNAVAYFYALIFRTPTIWWTLGEIPGRRYSLSGRLFRTLNCVFEHSSTAVLGYSSVAKRYFSKIGIKSSKQFIAVNVIDTDAATVERAKFECLQAHHQSDNHIILFVGALTPEKNVGRLFPILASVRKRIPSAKLVIVGDGPDMARLQKMAAEFNVFDSTLFCGKVEDGVGRYFGQANVFVLPGLGGLAISESLSWGLPVVCTQGDGCEVDLVVNGITGWIIDSSLPEFILIESFASKILKILENPDLKRKMSQAALACIREKYNISSYVANISNCIEYATYECKTVI